MRKQGVPLVVALAAVGTNAPAQETPGTAEGALDTVEIRARQDPPASGELKNVITQTEVITEQSIKRKQAGNVADALANEPGVNVSNECSMCAIKRVMLNGLRGEHTTVLVDGVPMHSTVSSYYGMDAVTASGIERIEISRGAGASLIAPEAIGGTVNIITKQPERDSMSIDVSGGENGMRRVSAVATAVSDDGATRAMISAQHDEHEQFDIDDNGVNEYPARLNQSVTAKISRDITAQDTLSLRVARFYSAVFGGPTDIYRHEALRSEGDGTGSNPEDLFAKGDVRNRFTGEAWETLEVIDTEREEYTLRWKRLLPGGGDVQITGSLVEHQQDSYYEGFDYANEDQTNFIDMRYSQALGMRHFITAGIDYKSERMRSESVKMDNDGIEGDDFDHRDIGIYLQDIWTPRHNLEIKLATRVDQINTNWTEKTAVGDEIDATMIAPRAHILWDHTDHWSSRIAAGRGYRTPLTFFESEHGLLESGFDVEIDEVETSLSSSYALSFEQESFAATGSVAHTQVENLAFIDDSGNRPVLINSPKEIEVTTFDVTAGVKLTENWRLDGNAAHFAYGDTYQDTFGVAPIEDRIRLEAQYQRGPWQLDGTATWVGSRDLEDYGYGGRYNRYDGSKGTDPKETDAPSFVTFDFKASRQIDDNFSGYVGVLNLLDYTQTDDGVSPLFYEGDGAYDVGHIYGPLRGRVAYAGFQAEF